MHRGYESFSQSVQARPLSPTVNCLLSSAEADVPSSGNGEKNTLPATVNRLDVLNKNHLWPFYFHFLCIKYNEKFDFSKEIMLVSQSELVITRSCY